MPFATFLHWLADQLNAYIGDKTAAVASAIAPAAYSAAVIYVLLWGWLQLSGRIQEPILEGVRRIVTLAAVLGLSLQLWQYHSLWVSTFLQGPIELAGAIAGAADPVATVDAIWQDGGTVAGLLWERGGVFNGDMGFYLAGLMVWLIVGMICIYTAFLIALSQLALAVLLALGPLFLVFVLFPATRRLFEAWIAQLTNYALVGVLTVLVATLMLGIVKSYAAQTAALGAALVTVDALNLLLVTVLVFLVMRQVPQIASGLASGFALATQELVARAAMSAGRRAGQVGRVSAVTAVRIVGAASGAAYRKAATVLPWRRAVP